MAKSIEMPFRLWATEPSIRWGPDFPRELAIFVGNVSTVHWVGFPSGKSYIECVVNCRKRFIGSYMAT